MAYGLLHLHSGRDLMIFGFGFLLLVAGVVYAVVVGVRSLTGKDNTDVAGEPTDFAEVAKSAAIHVGLFAALITMAVGTIDLFQALLESGERLAGSNSELAQPLSLLIVSIPAFVLLLRTVDRRYRQRASDGLTRPHKGWSIYLVVSLTTALLASLVTVGTIIDDLTSSSAEVDAADVAQLVVWLGVWLAHWFALRPRFRVLGDVHLAIGSIIGLAWLVTGVGAVLIELFNRGYDNVFGDVIAADYEIDYWLLVALVGLAVWAWHWLLHFDAPAARTSVEGNRRGTSLWYLTVVGAGVLPALATLLSLAVASIGGILIWFIGSTDQPAVEYFEVTPLFTAVSLIAVVSWAYHRWLLEREGDTTRNEALRFHDYAVTALGLIAVVGGVAALMTLLIDRITATSTTYFAGSTGIGNALIMVVTIIACSSAIWWWYWAQIEHHRQLGPVEESDSIWRKLYLIVGFGVAGVVLSVSLIWLLFEFLQDLLDGRLGRDTLDDLRGPIGWSIAVVGAVWYHIDVWRSDRRILAAHAAAETARVAAIQPPPPTGTPVETAAPATATAEPVASAAALPPAAAGPVFRVATADDHGEIFTLQRAAFVDEAKTYGTIDVPSLNETFENFEARMADSWTLVAVEQARIVGSISLRAYRPGGADIERLMVAPDRRRDGIAIQLLDRVEAGLRAQGHDTVQLIVGDIVHSARTLYDRRGFEFVSRDQAPDGPALLTLRKTLS